MADLDPWAPSDPLASVLHLLRMNGAFYCRSELTERWGMTLPPMRDYMWFHVVTSGRAQLETEGAEPRWLQAGDFSLVPHGTGHVLRSDPGVPAPEILELAREELSERYEILRHGEGGAPTTLICGAVRFEHPAGRTLVEALPASIRIAAADSPPRVWMESTMALMATEARALRPGGEAVMTRLADILVVQAIRTWLEQDDAAETGWLAALHDPQIGRVIALIHREPEREWTVASLAAEAAMSRSAFAARFRKLLGESAMSYVTRWRMLVADAALRSEGANVAELAARLGYRSEAAFARAFKRVIGFPPGAVKREAERLRRRRHAPADFFDLSPT
jgi:AraC-like DNA-binding protein